MYIIIAPVAAIAFSSKFFVLFSQRRLFTQKIPFHTFCKYFKDRFSYFCRSKAIKMAFLGRIFKKISPFSIDNERKKVQLPIALYYLHVHSKILISEITIFHFLLHLMAVS